MYVLLVYVVGFLLSCRGKFSPPPPPQLDKYVNPLSPCFFIAPAVTEHDGALRDGERRTSHGHDWGR